MDIYLPLRALRERGALSLITPILAFPHQGGRDFGIPLQRVEGEGILALEGRDELGVRPRRWRINAG